MTLPPSATSNTLKWHGQPSTGFFTSTSKVSRATLTSLKYRAVHLACGQIRLDAYHRSSASLIRIPGNSSPSSWKVNSAASQVLATLARSITANTDRSAATAAEAARTGSATKPNINCRRCNWSSVAAEHEIGRRSRAGKDSALRPPLEPEHAEKVVVAHDFRPHRICVLQHLLGLLGKIAGHGIAQRVDVISQVIGAGDRGIDADIGGETGDGDVFDSLGTQHLIETGAAERGGLNPRRQEQILVAFAGLQRLVIRGFLGADLPGLAQNLAAMETAGIGRVEFAIIVAVAFGDMDHRDAQAARLLDQIDGAIEQMLLVQLLLHVVIIGAGGIGERILEVDENERGFRRVEDLVEWRQPLCIDVRCTEQNEGGDCRGIERRSSGQIMKNRTQTDSKHGPLPCVAQSRAGASKQRETVGKGG